MRTLSRPRYGALLGVAALGAVAIAGCSQPSDPNVSTVGSPPTSTSQMFSSGSSDATAPAGGPAAGDEHAHKPGRHGGIIVSIGADSYHAEAVFEKGGTLKLLMLGKDESRVLEVESQKLKAYVKGAGATESAPVDLLAVPQEDDAEGKTSQFVAQLPPDLAGGELEVTIPNIRIDGERFRLGFSSRVEEHADDTAMPSSVSVEEERDLYLTPAGKYTASDIIANGNVTASQKYKGVISSHDLKPKSGDQICPVTLTKANPKFTWVIDGQDYLFCCPPCVDEYVKLAKEQPDELQPANSFVKN